MTLKSCWAWHWQSTQPPAESPYTVSWPLWNSWFWERLGESLPYPFPLWSGTYWYFQAMELDGFIQIIAFEICTFYSQTISYINITPIFWDVLLSSSLFLLLISSLRIITTWIKRKLEQWDVGNMCGTVGKWLMYLKYDR